MVLAMGFVSPEAAISKPLKLELDQVRGLCFTLYRGDGDAAGTLASISIASSSVLDRSDSSLCSITRAAHE